MTIKDLILEIYEKNDTIFRLADDLNDADEIKSESLKMSYRLNDLAQVLGIDLDMVDR